MRFSLFLLSLLFWGSTAVWWQIFIRWRQNRPVLERVEKPIPDWRTIPELTVAFIALVCVCLALFASAQSHESREPIRLTHVVLQVAVSFGLVVFLSLTLMIGGRPLSSYGVRFTEIRQQSKLGLLGFLSAVLPMALSMVVTFPFRRGETEHPLLKLIDGSPDVLTVGIVSVAAVLSAPLWEEFLFRVILQGWLSTLFSSSVSIGIVACSFSLVHGWQNGLALLPLALVLGYVFDRRRSYLSVVVIHTLFNATMITLELLNLGGSK